MTHKLILMNTCPCKGNKTLCVFQILVLVNGSDKKVLLIFLVWC